MWWWYWCACACCLHVVMLSMCKSHFISTINGAGSDVYIIVTRSTGTVHNSAKAHLTSVVISVPLSVVGRWRNDVIVAMAMPASACPALQHHAAQSVDTAFRISSSDQSGKKSLYPDSDLDFGVDPDHCLDTGIFFQVKLRTVPLAF